MKSECIETHNKLKPKSIRQPDSSTPDNFHETFFSDKIEIRKTVERGRFSVAKEFIPVGELLVNEEACMVTVSSNNMTSHCITCTKDTWAPLPCVTCCHVSFCSEACRQKGLEDHLKLCKIAHFISSFENSSNNSSLPIMATFDISVKLSSMELLQLFKRWKNNVQENDEVSTNKENILKVFKMVKHFSSIDLKLHFAVCVFILCVLKWLDHIPQGVGDEEESTFLVIICHILAAINSNIHTTCELKNSTDNLKMAPVGVSMFPDVALHLNHSCNPNTLIIDAGTYFFKHLDTKNLLFSMKSQMYYSDI